MRRSLVLALVVAVSGARAAEDLAARVERLAVGEVAAAVKAPDRFEAIDARADALDAATSGEVRLETLEVVGPNAFGVASVRFRMIDGGKASGETRATVRGVVRGPALVAKVALDRGVAVPEDAVEVRDSDLTRLDGAPLRDASELKGLAPVRTLGSGRVLTPELLSPPRIVRRGDPLELKVLRPGMTVVARGIARGNGAPGDRIQAENSVTGQLVLGEVQSDGSLLVLGPAARRGR